MYSIPAQSLDFNAILQLLTEAAQIGALIGILLGTFVFVLTERGTTALPYMLGGALIGGALAFVFFGTALSTSLQSGAFDVFGTASQNTQARTAAITLYGNIVLYTLIGAALGAAVSSFQRVVVGAFYGLLLGVGSGVVLLLANQQLGITIAGPLATILIAVVCLVGFVVINLGGKK